MGAASLALAIIVPSLMSLSFIVFLAVYVYYTKIRIINNESGTLLYLLDLKNRSYKMDPTSFNQKPFFKKDKFSGWKFFNELNTSLFTKEVVKRDLRELLQKLDNGSKYETMTIKYHEHKKKFVIFKFDFSFNEDNGYYIVKENWRTYHKPKIKDNNEYLFITKNKAVDLGGIYKGFIAFNLNPQETAPEKGVVDIANLFTANSNYFISNGMLVFVLSSKTKEVICKRIKKFIKMFQLHEMRQLGKRFYNGSATAYTKNVISIKAMNKVISTLIFLVDRSIESSEEFVSHTDKLVRADFNTFAIASNILRNAIKTDSIEFETRAVRHLKTSKKIIEYISPHIGGINSAMIHRLTRNVNNRNELIDKMTEMIGINTRVKEHVLVDARAEWLIENGDKLKYKQAIYVINYNQSSRMDELVERIKVLKKDGFFFALKINTFNKNVLSLLKVIEPNFIVISKYIKNEDQMYNSETLIDLMTIYKLSEAKKIKMIYEDPPTILDDITCGKIGLKFYYK